MTDAWLDSDGRHLGKDFPLPLDRTFDVIEAASHGVQRETLARLEKCGLLRRELRGVYVASQVPHDMRTRIDALTWVVSDDQVVCDRTAAWLHGVAILPRSAKFVAPPLDLCSVVETTRARRSGIRSTRRGLLSSDIEIVDGLAVTTPRRTALDLGRMLPRLEAIAALDGFLALGVTAPEVRDELARFRGFRGVVQLRALVPLADARSQSPGESALRLCWHDAGLPWPALQHEVPNHRGTSYYVDVADPPLRFGAEYDGDRHHTLEEDRRHDASRRGWLEREDGWCLAVFTKDEVYRRGADPVVRLARSYAEQRRSGLWVPGRRPRAS